MKSFVFLVAFLVVELLSHQCHSFCFQNELGPLKVRGSQSQPYDVVCWNHRLEDSTFEYVPNGCEESESRSDRIDSPLRRRGILAAASLAISGTIGRVRPAFAATEDVDENLNCLTDLPPKPSNYVRLYLCRHGETENNRLGRVQGARVDVDINDRGARQASRLGQALSRAQIAPSLFVHSPLARARQTASLAAQEITTKPGIQELSSIGEIDFGAAAEGQPVAEMRARMYATYGAWAIGEIDARMSPDGESGRDIFTRVERTMESLVRQANATPTQCLAAVAHSAYLRILLATMQEIPLAQISTLQQKNACVNVLDVPVDFRSDPLMVTASSPLVGGSLSHAPADWSLKIPRPLVLRVNERRHLIGLE